MFGQMDTGTMKAALQAAFGSNYGVTAGNPYGPGGFTIGPSGPPILPTDFGPPVYVPPSETVPIGKHPLPPIFQPPLREPPPSPSPGPFRVWHPRRMPRPVVRRPFKPRLEHRVREYAPSGELCPIVGYVRRPIPGVAEEQIFRCTAGQPVVIDPGLATVGRQEAWARHGLSGLGAIASGDLTSEFWSGVMWSLGAAAVAYFILRKKK